MVFVFRCNATRGFEDVGFGIDAGVMLTAGTG